MDIETLRQQWQRQAIVNRRLRGHDLIPLQLRRKLTALGALANRNKRDIFPLVKLFHPLTKWYWYVYEMDHENQDTLYCYVLGDFVEYGTVSRLELEALTVRGLPVERDLSFELCSIEQIEAWHKGYEPEGYRHW